MPNGVATPPEVIARLRELWDQGLSGAQIAAQMGMTKNAVLGLTNRNGFPPRPSPIHGVRAAQITLAQRDQVAALLRAGELSMPAIAEHLRVTLDQVRRVASAVTPARRVQRAGNLGGETRAQRQREEARRAAEPKPAAAFARPVGTPSKTCRWPQWGEWKQGRVRLDPKGPMPLAAIRFCDQPSRPGTSYCEACYARAYERKAAA